ncbi:MAG TPA: DUF72 domain-containing protein [Prosthecobacter sp.]|nr:DUF72 domain-containing protein [Prosthecobacter sp.]
MGRAEKMHRARLATEVKPPPKKPPPKINIGCSGWFYWHWKWHFYEGVPTGEWFAHYAKSFKTVELNAPFYSWPTVTAVQTWIRQAGKRRFVYTVKVCELITHVKRFTRTKSLVKDFGLIADLLGDRFGCFLYQLPPSHHYTPARLKAIVSQLEPGRRNVVEFRHKSWWNEKVYHAFREAGIIFCSCSGPRLPDELVKTHGEVYIRFHGTKRWYRHDYSDAELQEWAERIKNSGAERVWAYFNNDREGYAIKNAKRLEKLLGKFYTDSQNPVQNPDGGTA